MSEPDPPPPGSPRVYVTTARADVATRAYALKYLVNELRTLGCEAIFAGRVPRTGHDEFDDVVRMLPQTELAESNGERPQTDVHICVRNNAKMASLIPTAMHALRYAGHEVLAEEVAAKGLRLLQRKRVTQRELLSFVAHYVHIDSGPTISRPAGHEAARLVQIREARAVLAIMGGPDDVGVASEIGTAVALHKPVVVLFTDPRRADNPMLRHLVEASGGGLYWDHLSALSRLKSALSHRRPRTR